MGTGIRIPMLYAADTIRSIADAINSSGGQGLDTRTSSLTIRTRTWTGLPGTGTFVDADLVIAPKPFFAQVSAPEVSGSGGRYQTGDVKVGPITPAYTYNTHTGGYTPAQLAPKPSSKGVEVLYVVTGPNAGEYSLVELDSTSKAFSYYLILRRRRSTP